MQSHSYLSSGAPFGGHQNEIIGRGGTSTNGWVLDTSSQLLIWLPADLRKIFPQLPNILVIRPEGANSTSWIDISVGKS
jgi:hypothetical protein